MPIHETHDQATPRRELLAFAIVPFVATAIWYVLMLLVLLVVNGRLRLMTDVAAMALGGVIVGLPMAALLTAVLAIPSYFIVRATVGVTFVSVIVGGALIGLVGSAVLWMWVHEWSFISPWRAVVIGVDSGAAWWRISRLVG
jgi:hypothetical protein